MNLSTMKRNAETELHIRSNKITRRELRLNQKNNPRRNVTHLLRNSTYAVRRKYFPTLMVYINIYFYRRS